MTSDLSIQSDSEDFDSIWYLQTYPDVRSAGLDPLEHYLKTGRAEGRLGAPVRALELDHMLWRGYEAMALPVLEGLLADRVPRERAAAGWALARWRKDKGDIRGAYRAIMVFHETEPRLQTPQHPGPYLLGIQLCLDCGELSLAEKLLRMARERFGPLSDFEFAEISCVGKQNLDDWDLDSHLARLHIPHKLCPISLDPMVDGSRFDRLKADFGPRIKPLPDPASTVSVIVPVFNGARSLGTALRGLRAQSWPNLEILVVDDGSTDDTLAIARSLAEIDPRIRVIAHETNQGAYAARNTGFAEATGAFVTVHDADDWSHPEKIELQLMQLLAEPDLKASVSHGVRISNNLDMTRWRMEDRWVYRNVSSLMIRAELRETLGYWDRVKVNADTEYYYRIIALYGTQSIREVYQGVPLSFGRTEPGSLTNRSATHLRTVFKGVRRDYMEAAHAWHARASATPKGLYMPRFPEERPFRVSAAIGLGDAAGPMTDFDVLQASELFDQDWYRLSYLDVLMADISPVRHYLSGGAQENRDPGPLFSSGGYRRAMGLTEDVNPLLHYETEGRAAGANPLPCFPGALAGVPANQPRTLVFAHTSGKTLFGAERSLLSVVRRMADRGQNPVVVLPTVRNMAYLDALLSMTVAVEVLPQIWRHAMRQPQPETVKAIQRLIRKHNTREVHVNTLVLDAPLAAARAEGVESIVHVRELPAQDVALRRNLGTDAASLRAMLLAEADRFIVTSQPVADWLQCPERTRIRPNSVEEHLFDIPFEPGKILYVALISSNIAKKGIADFLKIARLVGEEDPQVIFRLIGPPTMDLHVLQPLPQNVEFRGYAETPAEALAQTDVVMSVSNFAESFGRTVTEAMAAGRPVICYDRGAPPTLVESGVSGFVVPADDTRLAADAVLALSVARLQLNTMSQAARIRARHIQELALRD